jgi:4-diphosphocytidyl-2-C-methyl-D-erythritol kinase
MRLLSYAKINLFLYVTGKRPDGYHELFSLMCPIDLHDTIELNFTGASITLRCSNPALPSDSSNLVYRAARLFFDCLPDKLKDDSLGVEIGLTKQIPVGAGLGGGSGNAATVLMGLNQHFGMPFSGEALRRMGLLLGADVPFFILGRPAIATGIGEVLSPLNFQPLLHVLLVNPGYSVSTHEVYKNLNFGLTNTQKLNKGLLFRAWKQDPVNHLWNDLEQVTASKYPEIKTIKEALLANGAAGALMTGSGPTVFGIFNDRHRALQAKEALSETKEWWLFLSETLQQIAFAQ